MSKGWAAVPSSRCVDIVTNDGLRGAVHADVKHRDLQCALKPNFRLGLPSHRSGVFPVELPFSSSITLSQVESGRCGEASCVAPPGRAGHARPRCGRAAGNRDDAMADTQTFTTTEVDEPLADLAPAIHLDHCVIHVSDWERSTAFYRDVLGAEVIARGKGFAYRFGGVQLNVHGPGLSPTPLAERPVMPGGSDLCFRWSGSIDDALTHLAAEGRPRRTRSCRAQWRRRYGDQRLFSRPRWFVDGIHHLSDGLTVPPQLRRSASCWFVCSRRRASSRITAMLICGN